jgi:hypothetical protein
MDCPADEQSRPQVLVNSPYLTVHRGIICGLAQSKRWRKLTYADIDEVQRGSPEKLSADFIKFKERGTTRDVIMDV